MKRTANIIFAMVLLLAGAVWANIKPVGFRCQTVSGLYADDVICDIAQLATEADLVSDGYSPFTTWVAFSSNLISEIDSKAMSGIKNFGIHFDTDIDLGGYSETDAACEESFAPMDFGSISNAQFTIDGDDHTIKNFCYIAEDEEVSFFGTLKESTVRDFNFENAYVKAKFIGKTYPAAAVVAYNVEENSKIVNVKVSNAKVFGWGAATIANRVSESSLSDIQIENVFVSLSKDVVENCTSCDAQSSVHSYGAGVARELKDHVEISNITVSNLEISDSVARIYEGKGEKYTGCLYAGGIAALANLTGEISLDGISISAKLSGSTVGGLIASVSANGGTTNNLKVTGAKVSLKSGDYNGTDQNRYLGGFFGVVSWKHGDVAFSANEVEFALTNKKTGAGAKGSDIGGLVGYFGGLNESNIPVNLYIEENQVKAEINAVEKQLYVGGFLGSVSLAGAPNSTLSIKKSTIKPIDPKTNPNVISAPNANLGMINAAYGVGGISNGEGIVEILGNHAEGDINIAATSVATSSNVGGMIGLANVKTLEMYNNTSVGNLLTSMTNGSEAKTSGHFYIGYEIGCVTEAYPSVARIKVNGNYHYGSKDVNARLAFGWLGESGNGAVSPELWKTQQIEFYQVYHNYRNAVLNGSVSLDAEGVLDIGGSGVIYVKNEEKWLYDGVIDSDAMKSRLFTYILNVVSAGAKDCSDPDAVCWENEVDSLPKISTYRTAYQISIDLDEIWDDLTDADKESLKENLVETKTGQHHSTLYSYTENYSSPNSDFARMVYGLSVVSGVFKTNGGVTATYVEEDLYSSYITGNTSFKAKAVPYEMVSLDVNLADQGVFYGADSDVEGGLVVPNSIRIIPIPSQIYTATSCVAGWSFDKNASDYAYHVSHSAEDIYKDVNAEKTLYAVWWDAEECAKGHYNRVRLLESEHGAIAVDEYREGAKVYTHDFAKDSTMLLPMGMLGNAVMVVHATPDSGYDLDSLVVDILDTVFFDGDTLPEYLKNATMTAYFSMSKGKGNLDPQGNEKQNQVRHELCKRGNAVGVYFATGKSKGNLEEYQVSLKDSLGMELEKALLTVDSVDYWTHFALVPGKYSVLVSHKGSGEPVLDTAFTVESEIKVEKDSWKLLALSDVDKSDLDWNGDQLFYWWDESAMFGDYWKYQKYQGENANATRGYWYNSLEGRALPLRHDEAMNGREIVWELDSGWNMMANPYGWDVVLRHESISMDDNDSLVVWTWLGEESNYGRNIWLYEYEAAYVYSNKKRTLKIDAEDYFVTWLPLSGNQDKALPKKRGNTALAKASARNNWTLQAVLADAAGHRDSWNVLGVGTVAELLEPPEGMGDHVNLSVMSGKKALAKSVVAPESGDGGYSWQVALSASTDRVGYLKFEGLADLAGLGYRVYVTYEGETREVPAGDSLRVLLKAKGNTATVQVTTSQVKALATKLENLRFERVSGALQVGFDVSDDLAGSPYRVQLVGVNGKVAATHSAKSAAGRNTLALTAPKPGLYLLCVTLGGHQVVRKVAVH